MIETTQTWRKAMVRKFGFYGFCLAYLPKHFSLPPAPFHYRLMGMIANDRLRRIEIIGFRGSAKSTIGSLAFPLYASLEKPRQYPFIIPVGDTALQAGINIANIKNEFENNFFIKNDYGTIRYKKGKIEDKAPDPTLESEEEWQAKNMLLNNGVRILARSRGQKVRGLRHRQYRPRLVIVDDPEDTEWIRFKENRDITEKWLRGEVIPAMDAMAGKLILIGNYLHDDALMARAKGWNTFDVMEIPLLDSLGNCLWPSMYPTRESLDKARADAGEVSWQREYLLKVVPDEGSPVRPEDIHYYDKLPNGTDTRGLRGHGVDFAISLKESADYTAVVHGDVYWDEKQAHIYVLPDPFNKHVDFFDTIKYLATLPKSGGSHMFFPEDVGYQKAALQEMERMYLAIHPMKPGGDKLSRLRVAAKYIKNGTVVFPRAGCGELINQILRFGVESHDDLVDALVNLILGLVEEGLSLKQFVRIQ